MKKRHAREIRAGILRARAHIGRLRKGVPDLDDNTLYARAFFRELARRVRPPRGGSGVSR